MFMMMDKTLLELYTAPMKAMFKTQYYWIDAMTLGMLREMEEEVEHSLVEASAITKKMINNIEASDDLYLSPQERMMKAEDHIDLAREEIDKTLKSMLETLVMLPFTRGEARPARKRFPVTIEGQPIN
ncbi:hypothetical protein [Marinibactrum halimedae]|uniref:Uncharacterized protein n=1 Tax=Marinibactrum halimedae TaxID=1444977 RepID=A0AA37T5N7_9GAMM|nr:hypothetical protein [Marinibactrum halimedae]MCD9461211.1 hypothetical protein [Marinibactrum halimedae]GLS25277.1 hypothetical protein GCM10007877_09910 [Marinibactrum halimedae]